MTIDVLPPEYLIDEFCAVCAGRKLVCSAHPDRPWNAGAENDCPCGAVGTVCLECAPLPAGIEVAVQTAG